jgi:aminoglycoside phosphotransferase (APT) family kinase protein
MTMDANVAERLATWLRTQISDEVRVEGLDRVDFGHSAEMMVLTVVAPGAGQSARKDLVLRLRPKPPALLEPYDLARQFTILRALWNTPVRVPRARWLEDTGDVLGRPFFVMERVAGEVYEMEAPTAADEIVVRMCQSLVEQLAAIHAVDLEQTGLRALDDGGAHLDRELNHWAVARFQARAVPDGDSGARRCQARQFRVHRRRGQRCLRLGNDNSRRPAD